MKNSKIGLLVHPFWMTLNGKKHLEHYSKIITSNKYDKLYVLVPILKYLFNGDLCTDKRINYIKKLLSVESKTKVIPLYYGGIGVFEVLAYHNSDFEGVENIDIFGEYYNVCVLGAAKYLFREEKIKVKLIKEHSIYFNKNNYLKNILKKNKGNTYLAVYNPEIVDEEGNLIKSKKYYGRR